MIEYEDQEAQEAQKDRQAIMRVTPAFYLLSRAREAVKKLYRLKRQDVRDAFQRRPDIKLELLTRTRCALEELQELCDFLESVE